MLQPDLFGENGASGDLGCSAGELARHNVVDAVDRPFEPPDDLQTELDLPAVLERLACVSARPRYTFMVLNLIARAAGANGSTGPYVREDDRAVPVRDWLTDALMPMAQRDARRRAIVAQVRADLIERNALPNDAVTAAQCIAEEVRSRLRHSGRTNVSRAVSDLVRAGLLHRHYQGYRVDHPNRGAQREAVYTILPSVKRALGRAA